MSLFFVNKGKDDIYKRFLRNMSSSLDHLPNTPSSPDSSTSGSEPRRRWGNATIVQMGREADRYSSEATKEWEKAEFVIKLRGRLQLLVTVLGLLEIILSFVVACDNRVVIVDIVGLLIGAYLIKTNQSRTAEIHYDLFFLYVEARFEILEAIANQNTDPVALLRRLELKITKAKSGRMTTLSAKINLDQVAETQDAERITEVAKRQIQYDGDNTV